MARSFERDIIPMARSEGMLPLRYPIFHYPSDMVQVSRLLPGMYSPLESSAPMQKSSAGGRRVKKDAPFQVLIGSAVKTRRRCRRHSKRSLGKSGQRLSPLVCHLLKSSSWILRYCSVAIAYLMQKTPYVFPIIGGRKVEHLLANVEALDITLTHDQITFLESIIPFDPGFPTTMIVCTHSASLRN